MLKYFSAILIAGMLASCNNNRTDEETREVDTLLETDESAADLTTKDIDSMCYLLVEGATIQDTKVLKLVIDGDDVTGALMYLPHEKDARFGNIRGSRDGDIIFGTWFYDQEGEKDSIDISFKKDGNDMLQQVPSFNEKTGREYLNTSSPYSIRYSPTDCRNLPQHKIDYSR